MKFKEHPYNGGGNITQSDKEAIPERYFFVRFIGILMVFSGID